MLFGYIHKKSLHAYLFCVSDPNYITVNQVRCDSINFSFSYCYCERRQLHIRWSMIWSNHFFFVMLKWISKPVRTCRTLMTSYFIWCRIYHFLSWYSTTRQLQHFSILLYTWKVLETWWCQFVSVISFIKHPCSQIDGWLFLCVRVHVVTFINLRRCQEHGKCNFE